MQRLALLSVLLLALPACSSAENTAEEAADTTADVATDVADATADVATDAADVAVDAADAVTDAAGSAWNATTDLFDDDPDVDAAALVRPTSASGARAQGTVRFMYEGDDLVADLSLRGLDPGPHGFHIHVTPDCSAADTDGDGRMEPAGAAGGHWDPMNTGDHGSRTEDDDDRHAGDLGNISANSNGTVETTVTVEDFEPSEYPVAGRAVVIHSGRDDLETDPAGDAGTRVGCGVIEARM